MTFAATSGSSLGCLAARSVIAAFLLLLLLRSLRLLLACRLLLPQKTTKNSNYADNHKPY
jgi:hypothetical protein